MTSEHLFEPKDLIPAVELRPLLWDTSVEDYKDKSKKDAAWIDVCLCLFKDFAEKPEPVQKVLLQDVKSRWRTVRDNYIRTLKKQAISSKKVKNYIYAKELSFLKKNEEAESTINSDPDSESFSVCIKEKSATRDHFDLRHRNTRTFAIRKRPKLKRIFGENSHDLMHASRLRRNTEIDEDVAFFYSLLPTVRSLNVDKKFTFRLQTMQLLQTLKQSLISNTANANAHTTAPNSDDDESFMFAPEVQLS